MEWLVEKCIEVGVCDCGVRAVAAVIVKTQAADTDGAEIRIDGFQHSDDGRTVHARHHQIGKNERNSVLIGLEKGDGFLAALGR